MARFSLAIAPGLVFLFALGFTGCRQAPVDFSTQIKPILNEHCLACHGGVKRSGGFSLLFRQDALAATDSGKPAILPGNAGNSEMIRRLTHPDPELRMPYREDPLSEEEIDLLKRWIEQGASWSDHWAYVPPAEPSVPSIAAGASWPINKIDHFVLARLRSEGMTPAGEADKAALLRRVYLDLAGVPPTPEQADAFFADTSPEAYEKVVDSLLRHPRFGEKWASWWLDLARYADTKGYERDPNRSIWRYRDWVIRAFNQDMPFDQFTVEQLAGDLLPDPTDDQLIATAFHRNTMSNDEGGTEDEEFRVAAVIDRVNTTMEALQSTTFACVQCHSHPYDPFRHEEYYRFMAFFNNTADADLTDEHPKLRHYGAPEMEEVKKLTAWVKAGAGPAHAKEVRRFLRTLEPKYHPNDCDQFVNGELIDTKWLGLRPGGSCRLPGVVLDGKNSLLFKYWTNADGGILEIRKNSVDGDVIGQAALPNTQNRRRVISIPLQPGLVGKADLYFVMYNDGLPTNRPVCASEWFAFLEALPGAGDREDHQAMRRTFLDLLNAKVEETPIMMEKEADRVRPTHVLERGNWLMHGPEVTPAVPASLNDLPGGAPANRLGLARWLVSPDNPLTARTVVNRFWEQLFGRGLVATMEDFGSQGDRPAHPELLDWLARRFMHDYQWSMKRLLRAIVLSATYRQDARLTPEGLERDPDNRLLARGPRLRLSAEQIRDQALAVSGLLSGKMYGPSVMPYQPEGVWQTVYNGSSWELSEGEDRYRRAVYTFLKRTSPYPSAMQFDASSREVCQVARIRTNTPLQALVLLNDPTFVETAQHFARRMQQAAGTPPEQIKEGYYRLVFREMPEAKLSALLELYDKALKKQRTANSSLVRLTGQDNEDPELAALTVVANAMLNLDEVVMKE